MYSKFTFLASFFLVAALFVSATNAQPLQQDPGPDGIVSVEAENYDANVEVNGHAWVLTGPTGGFTGTGMWAPNGQGGHTTDYAANSERLEYEINFVKTGTHYVWILGWGASGTDDTCHAGLDGVETPLSNNIDGFNNNHNWRNSRYQNPERAQIEITTPGLHVLNIWVREDGCIVDKIVLTTNPDFTLTGAEPGPPESTRGARVVAFGPTPGDGDDDVPRDVTLGWEAGGFAASHDVYFGTVFNDVNDGIGGVRQSASSYAPLQRLDFETTYYWRVDEVNAPPDSTVFRGEVWSFTTEPVAYPVVNVTATASSSAPGNGPENAVNGSGLSDDLHSTAGDAMWLSAPTGPQPTWIQFEFDKAYTLNEMWVWNSNTAIEASIGFGTRDVSIEYSIDGIDYVTLGTTHEFARAPGLDGYAHNTTVDLGGLTAKYVRLATNSNWGGFLPQFGLSEVRFFSIPMSAREPSPDSGATDVDLDPVLGWRAGRAAATHDLYLSDDGSAVVDGTAPVTSLTVASHGPVSLDMAKRYFWRVDEVNDVETPAVSQGDIWTFKTEEFIVVEDFESYNDIDPPDPDSNRIFEGWPDGFGVATNGALVGYDPANPSYAEVVIVHGGKQSMPVFYSNTLGVAFSEVTRTLAAQNWTDHGIQTLSLWFYGDPTNTPGQLYVKINGVKVLYDGDAGNLTGAAWQAWNIDLTSVGANLQSVTSLAVGIEGAGATGTLLFDDIRLYSYPRTLITPVQPDPASLVAFWGFDGNYNDSSGNGRNGTPVGAITFEVDPVMGQVVSLPGGDDQFVNLGSVGISGNMPKTIACWAKADNTNIPDWTLIFGFTGQADGTGGNGSHFNIGSLGGPGGVGAHVWGWEETIFSDDAALNWHHYAMTYDGTTIQYYGDGIPMDTDVAKSNVQDLSASADRVHVGSRITQTSSFPGKVDDAQIFNRVLSDAEIAALAGRTLPFDKAF